MHKRRAVLAPYPDQDGVPFYLGKKVADEKALFRSGALMRTRDADTGLAWPSRSPRLPSTTARKRCSSGCANVDGADKSAQKAFAKTGLGALAMRFQDGRGAEFLAAMETVNDGRDKRPEKPAVESAARKVLRFLERGGADARQELARAASFSASSYLMSMNLLELLDHVEHRAKWANKLVAVKDQKPVRACLRDPTDTSKLAGRSSTASSRRRWRTRRSPGRRRRPPFPIPCAISVPPLSGVALRCRPFARPAPTSDGRLPHRGNRCG